MWLQVSLVYMIVHGPMPSIPSFKSLKDVTTSPRHLDMSCEALSEEQLQQLRQKHDTNQDAVSSIFATELGNLGLAYVESCWIYKEKHPKTFNLLKLPHKNGIYPCNLMCIAKTWLSFPSNGSHDGIEDLEKPHTAWESTVEKEHPRTKWRFVAEKSLKLNEGFSCHIPLMEVHTMCSP